MAYLRLILKNAVRNRRRTVLTLLSVAASLFLLVSLRTLVKELEGENLLSDQSARRLMTRHAVALQMPLPVSYKPRIARLPGVQKVTEYQLFASYYREPKNIVVLFGIDDAYIGYDPEYVIPPDSLAAFRSDRRGVLVPDKLMRLYGWKIGDRITFEGTIIPVDLELIVRGTYSGPSQSSPLFHFEYFNELIRQRIPTRADLVTTFGITVHTRADVAPTARAIDEMFRNSSYPTRTESEKDFILNFSAMLGNVTLFIGGIAAAVVFAVILVTATTMAMTVRERMSEVAILRTLGFRRYQIFGLITGEASLIAVIGGSVGMAIAFILFETIDIFMLTGGIMQHFEITADTLALGVVVALALGVIASAGPAMRAASISIPRAMRE